MALAKRGIDYETFRTLSGRPRYLAMECISPSGNWIVQHACVPRVCSEAATRSGSFLCSSSGCSSPFGLFRP